MADIMDEWREAAEAYEERFGDVFPLMEFGGDIPEAIEEIRRRIEAGEPFESDMDVDY